MNIDHNRLYLYHQWEKNNDSLFIGWNKLYKYISTYIYYKLKKCEWGILFKWKWNIWSNTHQQSWFNSSGGQHNSTRISLIKKSKQRGYSIVSHKYLRISRQLSMFWIRKVEEWERTYPRHIITCNWRQRKKWNRKIFRN